MMMVMLIMLTLSTSLVNHDDYYVDYAFILSMSLVSYDDGYVDHAYCEYEFGKL